MRNLKKIILTVIISLICAPTQVFAAAADYVDPFIGTSGGGNTFPGAVRPWGMVSVSPHNDLASPPGYTYGKQYLYGFGHLHLSGTGCPDLGNVLLMAAYGEQKFIPEAWKAPYGSEKAKPGYYSVKISNNILAEMSCTKRAGISRYTYQDTKRQPAIILSASHALISSGSKVPVDAWLKIVSASEASGWVSSGGFCSQGNRHKVYFVVRFSEPFERSQKWVDGKPDLRAVNLSGGEKKGDGPDVGAVFYFKPGAERKITVKTGISYVSIRNAGMNLDEEVPSWDFESVYQAAASDWNTQLSKVQVKGGSEKDKKIFYTAMYHMLIHPNIFSDVNGEFKEMKISRTGRVKTYTRYTVFSLWDTYRTLHPFLTIVYPQQQLDMVKSMVGCVEDSGSLPRWELAGDEASVMVGDPGAIVVADTYLKGLKKFNVGLAYSAMKRNASLTKNNGDPSLRPGLGPYLEYGFIPGDHGGSSVWGSVSTSLEYYLADSCIGALAQELKKAGEAGEFISRSENYAKLYDPLTGFFRQKTRDGKWSEPFNPASACCDQDWPASGGPGFVEGTAWQYLFFVPHDIDGLKQLMGGSKKFTNRLQECFDKKYFDLNNEPDMAYPYLFNYIKGEAWRTQRAVKAAIAKYFTTGPAGLPGNDDCGTMSGWYVFSAMGIYPDAPGKPFYQIGSPVFDEVTIALDSRYYYIGKLLTIRVVNNSPANIYVQSATWNGVRAEYSRISHAALTGGGTLELVMGDKPAKNW